MLQRSLHGLRDFSYAEKVVRYSGFEIELVDHGRCRSA